MTGCGEGGPVGVPPVGLAEEMMVAQVGAEDEGSLAKRTGNGVEGGAHCVHAGGVVERDVEALNEEENIDSVEVL